MYAIAQQSSQSLKSAFLIILCLCVLLQMLGVAATLLDPAGPADSFAPSALEGFSLPPTPPTLSSDSGMSMPLEGPLITHVPILLDSFFHPPLN